MKSIALVCSIAILMCMAACASRGIFEINPRKISTDAFDSLLGSDVTLQEVKRVLGEPRLSGGTIDVAPDGSVIDLPRFDYVLALEDQKKKPEVVFVSFWFRGSRVDEVYLRDPKSSKNLKRIFPSNEPKA